MLQLTEGAQRWGMEIGRFVVAASANTNGPLWLPAGIKDRGGWARVGSASLPWGGWARAAAPCCSLITAAAASP